MKVLLTSAALKALVQLGENAKSPCPRSAIDELLRGGYIEARGYPSELLLTDDGKDCLRSLGIRCAEESENAVPRKRPWHDA